MPIGDGTRVNNVIKSGAQIMDGVPEDNGKLFEGNWLTQTEFVNLVSQLWVCFDNYFVRVFGIESYYPEPELLDVMLCPVNL